MWNVFNIFQHFSVLQMYFEYFVLKAEKQRWREKKKKTKKGFICLFAPQLAVWPALGQAESRSLEISPDLTRLHIWRAEAQVLGISYYVHQAH